MTAKLGWETILNTFELGGYGGSVVLEDSTVLLALIALDIIRPYWHWEDYEDFDDVETAVDLAIAELMGVTTPVGADIKIAESVYTSDVAEPYVDDFDAGAWTLFKLVISGMVTNSTGIWADGVEVEYNDDQLNASYSSLSVFSSYTAQLKYQILKGYPANIMEWVSASTLSDTGVWGNAEINIYTPLKEEHKGAHFHGNVPSYSNGQIAYTTGTHGIHLDEAIEKILIRPFYGTTFLVGGVDEPSELRMTLYGYE